MPGGKKAWQVRPWKTTVPILSGPPVDEQWKEGEEEKEEEVGQQHKEERREREAVHPHTTRKFFTVWVHNMHLPAAFH